MNGANICRSDNKITVYCTYLGCSFCCCCPNRTSMEHWIPKQLLCRWFSEQHPNACWWFWKVPHCLSCAQYTQCLCTLDVLLQYKFHGCCRVVCSRSALGIYIDIRSCVSCLRYLLFALTRRTASYPLPLSVPKLFIPHLWTSSVRRSASLGNAVHFMYFFRCYRVLECGFCSHHLD